MTGPRPLAGSALRIEALEVAYGGVTAVRGVSLTAAPGELLTLLGPSGCGKTTTLRAVAGLETPRAGRIALNDRVVFDRAAGIDLPPERRGLAMVFQSYAIWPHMSVFENVAFGLRARKVRGAALADAVRTALDSVGLGALIDRPATRLSGGQQQRVALARAIAANPGIILFDEPLSNLDAQLRLAMRLEIKALQSRLGIAALYVTHDQEEAMALSDRIAVLRDGAVEQVGTPAEIHDRPASAFVAHFMGMRNVLPCTVLPDGDHLLAQLSESIRVSVRGPVPDGASCLCFRPSSVRIATEGEGAPALLTTATYLGDTTQYTLQSGGLTLIASSPPRSDLQPGQAVQWYVPPENCLLVPA